MEKVYHIDLEEYDENNIVRYTLDQLEEFLAEDFGGFVYRCPHHLEIVDTFAYPRVEPYIYSPETPPFCPDCGEEMELFNPGYSLATYYKYLQSSSA